MKLKSRFWHFLLLSLACASSGATVIAGEARFYVRDSNHPSGYQRPQRADSQRDYQRRDYQRNEEDGRQRSQRLSPEERRQLRNDIRDAGRDIYPARRNLQR